MTAVEPTGRLTSNPRALATLDEPLRNIAGLPNAITTVHTLAVDVYPHVDTDRPTVLLLHGGGQNRHAWATSARRLHAHGYPVVVYDTRGHGDSEWDPTGEYDMEQLTHDCSRSATASMVVAPRWWSARRWGA